MAGSRDFEELGRKVQRAAFAVERIRGVGVVDGIRVVVDAENRLVSVSVAAQDAIVAAYRAAVDDARPQVEDAMREVRADPRVEAMSTFVEANAARLEAERVRRAREIEEDDDAYYEERYRRGWLEH